MPRWNVWFPFWKKNNSVKDNKTQKVLFFCLVVFFSLGMLPPASAYTFLSQQKRNASQKKEKKKSLPRDPKKASLMAIVPGLGQIYNHKYWKLPIVYAGFGVVGYFVVTNTRYYNDFKEAYNCKVTNPDCTNPLSLKYDESTLRYIRDYYRRNMQLSYIIGGAWYLLQIVDANVDAHLSHWNISDNLSLEVSPVYHPVPQADRPAWQGIQLRFKF